MREHYNTELSLLQKQVSDLGRKVVSNIETAAAALFEADDDKAGLVLHEEHTVDFLEVRIEEECQKIIALHQPVADDLRFIIGVMKIDHELERISDLAVCVARKGPRVSKSSIAAYEKDLRVIFNQVILITRKSLESIIGRDVEAAKSIWQGDDIVDEKCEELAARVKSDFLQSGSGNGELFDILSVIADLERIADHGVNIAKTAIYLILGRIVRHRGCEFRAKGKGSKIKVLFVCVHNSARSQIAAAWLNHLFGDRYVAESAGITPGVLNQLAVQAMSEVGIDISGNKPRDVFEVVKHDASFDYVITVCDGVSAELCPPVLGIAEQIQWEFENPDLFIGDDDERLAQTRRLRDAIKTRIEDWVGAVR